MKLPKRPPAHIKESESWKILQNSVPSLWMVRDISERDYGIDCYIELVSNKNTVTGDLLSAQLKGTENIAWKHSKTKARREAKFTGIKIETINYWMNLSVPVFLFVAETSTKNLYFAPIKHQVRNQYSKYLKQGSLSFSLSEEHSFADETGLLNFIICYIQEKTFRDLTDLSRTLLIHLPQYYEFILSQQDLDPFLEVEPEEELMFVHIYLTIHNLCNLLAIDWDIIWLDKICENDKKTWSCSFSCLYNLTMTEILPLVEKKLAEVLGRIKTIMTVYQKEYWEKKEYILYRKAKDLDISNLKTLIY